jgi:hypothetical protein
MPLDRSPENHALAKVLPDAEMRVVPNQGHSFHYAVSGQVLAAVDDVSDRAGSPSRSHSKAHLSVSLQAGRWAHKRQRFKFAYPQG